MGLIIIDPTPEELCDLMCGVPEEDMEDEEWEAGKARDTATLGAEQMP